MAMANEDTTRLNVLEADDQKTTVGNYFVSNYPPYSTWSTDHRDAGLAMFDTPAAPGRMETTFGIMCLWPGMRPNL